MPDAGRYAADRTSHSGRVLEQNMQTAGARAMCSGGRQEVAVVNPPLPRAMMLYVEVEHIKVGSGTGSHPDQLAGMRCPQRP